jgi:translocation and assembly module TamB
MTNPPPQTPTPRRSPEENRATFWQRLVEKAKRPSTIIIGVATIAFGAIAYGGVRYLVYEKLPPFLESQLGNTINRPIDIGEVKGFSLNSIEFGASAVPATPTDSDRVELKGIEADFNILPLLFGRALPLEITLLNPKVYIEQDKNGSWLNLNLDRSQGRESITLDTKVNVRDGEVSAIPYNDRASTINMQVNGSGRYNPANDRQVQYDFDAAIANAKANIKGETFVETGTTVAKVFVRDLLLANLVPLIPNSPVNINNGRLNANLNVNIPSFDRINATRIQGLVSLQNLKGEARQLSQPFGANSELRFRNERVGVENTQANLGDLVARVSGNLNWEKGYDLDINVLPFNLNNLVAILPTSLPVDTDGILQANLKLSGAIKQPHLTGTIANVKPVRIEQTIFKQVNSNFSANLDDFVLKNLRLIPAAGGQIIGNGVIETNIAESLQKKQAIDPQQMPLAFNFNASLPTEKLVTPYYKLPSNINVGAIDANGQVRGTIENPQANLQWQTKTASNVARTDISGAGKVFLAGDNFFLRDTQINVDRGIINVAGSGNLANKTWQTSLLANSISLNPFLSQLRSNQLNLDRPINLTNSNVKLAGTFDFSNLNKITGVANANLNVDGGNIGVKSQLDSGNLQASANTSGVPIDRFLPNLDIPIALRSSQVNISGRLQQLLAIASDWTPSRLRDRNNLNLSTFKANANAQLDVARGTVNAIAQLNNNRWQTNLTANNLNSSLLLPNIETNLKDPLNARVNLSGSIDPLLKNTSTTIQANTISVRSGRQFLNANGNAIVSNLTTKPDIDRLNLNVAANSNLAYLPIDRLIANTSTNNELLPQQLSLRGIANFSGNLSGQNLLSAPLAPGNLLLNGNLRLNDLAINQRRFDRVLAGKVNVNAQELTLDLRGRRDVIAASAERCIDVNDNDDRCRLPYFPNYLVLRQGEGRKDPLIATGKRNGDVFGLDVQNFPLALLNVTPANRLGIQGAVAGDVTGNANINLFNFATVGNIRIDRPAVGYLQAKQLAANFAYDSNNNIARLASASLQFGNSIYNAQGDLNLRSGQVNGKLDIPKAYIQDVLTTFRWFEIEDVTRLLKTPDYASASAVSTTSVGNTDASISRLINLLLKIERQIQAKAEERKGGDIPTQLDIEGGYTGEVNLAGSIADPLVDFQVRGNNWQWLPQPSFPNIIEPLGFVKEQTQPIPINQVIVDGNFANKALTVKPVSIQIADTILSLQGQVFPQQQTANFKVQNLSLDRIRNFVNIPLDATGIVNVEGTINGTPQNPKVRGNLALTEGSINSRLLPQTIAGNFNYTDSRLQFNTTEPSSIQLQANLPVPTRSGMDNRFNVNAKLDTEAFNLINAITNGQIAFAGGKGEADLNASGRLNIGQTNPISDLTATGKATVKDATFKTAYFAEPLKVNAQIALNNQVLNVQQLQGTFAQSKVSAAGIVPLLNPIAASNPLTIAIEKGKINLTELYEGEVEGNVTLSNTALRPVISGKVNLRNGQATVPAGNENKDTTVAASTAIKQAQTQSANNNNLIVPSLVSITLAYKHPFMTFASKAT